MLFLWIESQNDKVFRLEVVIGPLTTVADPGGAVWGNCPPKPLWRPLEWRPFAINAPLFGAHGSRNRFKNTLK